MNASEKLIRTLILMVFLILSACTLEMMPRPDPTPAPVLPTTPAASQPLPPYGAATAPAAAECAGKPALTPQVAYPLLNSIEPQPAAPGQEVKVTGSKGYLYWDDPCQKGYLESSRDFSLFLDGQWAGKINCYANHCEVKWVIPAGTLPGAHTLSTEGGSQLRLEVIQK